VNNTVTGWLRLPGGKWQAVVTVADQDTAWGLLRQHIEQLDAKVIDTYVGSAGADPNHRQRRFPRCVQK
jgi:hypothetical protein